MKRIEDRRILNDLKILTLRILRGYGWIKLLDFYCIKGVSDIDPEIMINAIFELWLVNLIKIKSADDSGDFLASIISISPGGIEYLDNLREK